MEILPALRCHMRRASLCLYLVCVLFAACAFYTLYFDSNYGVVQAPRTVQTILATEAIIPPEARPRAEKQRMPPSPEGQRLTGTSPQSLSKSPGGNADNNKLLDSISNSHKSTKSQHTILAGTKYIYLNVSSTSSSTSSTALALKTSTPAPPQDTCQVSGMKNSKLILLWTPFFGTFEYVSKERFKECSRCRNCRITNDRSKIHESDAVVFHARDMSMIDLPPVRYPHQRWIFFCLESPPYSDFPGLQHMRNMFNWTMTYRSDSDIVTQYGLVSRVYPSRKLDYQYLEWAWSNKTKSVVWMSSHCPTHGGRDAYVEELRKYIDVDVYGTCGTSICPPGETKRCLQEFADKYKFFLAFENAVCMDYITEKFFRTLKYNIIPVVFGGAKYDKFVPPGSYIDALSFKSPKHLAFFLSGVGKDFRLYSSYFRWRKDYSVRLSNYKECVLCSLLHKKDFKPSSYEDLRQWWVEGSKCRTWTPKR